MTEVATHLPSVDYASNAPAQEDYFGFQATERYTFPDGLSWIEFEVMNEGKKVKFQKATGRDIVLQRSGDARMRMDPGSERHELIKACVIDWNLSRQGVMVPLNPRSLDDFLKLANPRVVEELEKAIRKANPWLLGDISSDDIQKQIDDLEEMKLLAVEREQGESASGSK